MAGSVLLSAPWRGAWRYLRHRPGLLVTATVTGVIVGLVAAAPVLFVSSVGAGAVQVQYSRACPASLAPTLKPLPASYWSGSPTPKPEPDVPLERLRAAVGGDLSFAPAEHIEASYSAFPVVAGDQDANIGFLVRDTFRDHIEIVSAEVPGDVWIPDTLQTRLAVGPGDVIEVTRRDGEAVPLVVAGVFRDLASKPLDSYWCAATIAIVPQNMYGEVFPPPMAIVERATFQQRDLRGSLYFSRFLAEFAQPPTTVADATRLAESTARVFDAAAANPFRDSVVSGVERLEQRSRLVRTAVSDTTAPVAVLAVVCALVLAGVLGLVWVRVRRNSCVALSTMGVAPAAIGAKAAAETGGALVAGAVLGCLTARCTMQAWAPSDVIEPGVFEWALGASLVAALAGMIVVGAVVASSCRTLLRVAVSTRRRWIAFVPFELVFVAVAWLAARDLRPTALVPLNGRRVVDTSAAVLVLPIAVFALGSLLAARVWWWLTRRSRSGGLPSHLSRRLALRRLQHGARAGTGILGAGTLAFGVSIFGMAMNTSLERTGEAKSGVFVGADVSVLIAGELPSATPGATEVWLRERMDYDGVEVDLIAVDPATFAQVAFWDDAFADRSLPALLDELGRSDGSARAIAVGAVPVAAAGQLTNPNRADDSQAVKVVATAAAFPGAHMRPTLVMSLASAREGPIAFRHFVWTNGDFLTWRVILRDLGAQPVLAISRQSSVDSSVLQFAGWSFDFVKALGVFVGALVVVAALLYLAARQRQQALGFAFLRRMGFTTRRHWWALVIELAGLLSAVFVLGSVLAVVCVRIVSPNVDPLPSLPPSPLMVVPWSALAISVAIGGAVVLAGTALAQFLGARVDVAEVLRDGT